MSERSETHTKFARHSNTALAIHGPVKHPITLCDCWLQHIPGLQRGRACCVHSVQHYSKDIEATDLSAEQHIAEGTWKCRCSLSIGQPAPGLPATRMPAVMLTVDLTASAFECLCSVLPTAQCGLTQQLGVVVSDGGLLHSNAAERISSKQYHLCTFWLLLQHLDLPASVRILRSDPVRLHHMVSTLTILAET